MEGIVYTKDTNVVFLIPDSGGYICPDWKQYRCDNSTFPPEDTDVLAGPLELVVWKD